MQFFECLIPPYTPLPTQSCNKVHSEVHIIYFQKIPAVLSKCGAIAIESTFEIGDLRGLHEFEHVKQTRLKHVKNQMANLKNLILYFETSLCAVQKSYKNHDDPKHLSRVIALESYKKWAKTCLHQRSPSLSRQV